MNILYIERIKRWRKWSRKRTISYLIHRKYSIDDECAILRQRDSKPEEFEEYNAFCEECKKQAKILCDERDKQI